MIDKPLRMMEEDRLKSANNFNGLFQPHFIKGSSLPPPPLLASKEVDCGQEHHQPELNSKKENLRSAVDESLTADLAKNARTSIRMRNKEGVH